MFSCILTSHLYINLLFTAGILVVVTAVVTGTAELLAEEFRAVVELVPMEMRDCVAVALLGSGPKVKTKPAAKENMPP